MGIDKIFLLLISCLLYNLSSYAQLDTVVNYLSNRYSSDSHNSIKIPSGKKGVFKTGDAHVDSLIMLSYKKSDFYCYHLIDSLASDEELVKLTSHKSPIIIFYAAYALGKRDTLLLPEVLKKMMDNIVIEGCASTDVVFDRSSASMIFSGLWERKRATGYPTDVFMDSLYSIYLLHPKIPSMEIGVVLTSLRKSLKKTIEILAFERKNMSAIRYMNKWYKAEYYDLINKTCFELLDSTLAISDQDNGLSNFRDPTVSGLLQTLVDLKDKPTLRKAGGWLKNNRQKWVGLKGIDEILDNSWEIKDSIKWGQERYPFTPNNVNFLIGEWAIISGMNIKESETKDTIVLERKDKVKGNYQKIKFELGQKTLFSCYYENINYSDKKVKMVGSPTFDEINNRICFGSLSWEWYKIKIEENRLILIKEKYY